MTIINRYIITVSILLLSTTVILIGAGQSSLDIFYTIYVVEALIITELFVYFNHKVRRDLNMVSIILFGGFTVALGFQVLKLLA